MPRAANIPDERDLLCEFCGYTLNTLDPAGLCPECGRPIAGSSPQLRHAPPWEDRGGRSKLWALPATAAAALFTPGRFFRRLTVPGDPARSRQFRTLVQVASAVLLGAAAWGHAQFGLAASTFDWRSGETWLLLPVLIVVAYLLIVIGTALVIRLTAFEAAYRGLRLPGPVVARAMDYHAVHLIPPALLGLAIPAAYTALAAARPMLAADHVMAYIYTLAGAVVVSAVYLFVTYWAAMRRLMYANRAESVVRGP